MEKYHRFVMPQEVDEWVKKNYTLEELKERSIKGDNFSLMYYKGIGYKRMNKWVRENSNGFSGCFDPNELQQFLLSKEIGDSIEVCRFVSYKELYVLEKQTSWNRIYRYPSFLSTTLLEEYFSMDDVKRWRVPISIRIPKGTPGTYIPEINTDMPEYEVLLPFGLKVRKVKSSVFEVIGF